MEQKDRIAAGWNAALLAHTMAALGNRRTAAYSADEALGLTLYEELLDVCQWPMKSRPSLYLVRADFTVEGGVFTKDLNIVALTPEMALEGAKKSVRHTHLDGQTPVKVYGPPLGAIALSGEVVAELTMFTMGDEATPVGSWMSDDPAIWAVAEKAEKIKNLRLAEKLIENTLRAVEIVDIGEAGAAWSAALWAVRAELAAG